MGCTCCPGILRHDHIITGSSWSFRLAIHGSHTCSYWSISKFDLTILWYSLKYSLRLDSIHALLCDRFALWHGRYDIPPNILCLVLADSLSRWKNAFMLRPLLIVEHVSHVPVMVLVIHEL